MLILRLKNSYWSKKLKIKYWQYKDGRGDNHYLIHRIEILRYYYYNDEHDIKYLIINTGQ
jgi:hypothetical protein